MKRISKENYYLNMAETALERSTCLRRKWGAVIVKNDEIISTGYNGAPRGRKNCDELGYCIRDKWIFLEERDTNYVEVFMQNKMQL